MKNLRSFLAAGLVADPQSSLGCQGYYDDAIGTLEMGDAQYLGAPQRYARSPGPGRRPMGPPRMQRNQLVPDVPGVPQAGLRIQPLGLGSTAFTATSGLLLALTASPQKPFKPQRLIVDITRTGTTSTGLVTVTRIDIGADNMLVASGPLPVSMFANTGVDLNLSFAPATPGITITVQLACSLTPTSPDRIDVSAGMLGTSYGF